MKTTRTIFLDVDGVLNNSATFSRCGKRPGQTISEDWIDRDCVLRLNWLCKASGASLVISSGWPSYLGQEKFVAVMRAVGVEAPIVGFCSSTTPEEVKPESTQVRWDAIRSWLDGETDKACKAVTELLAKDPEAQWEREDHTWVILDDCDWEGFPADRFVKTDISVGLTAADVQRALEILMETDREGVLLNNRAAELLLIDPEYRKQQYERGREDALAGRSPSKLDGPYMEGYRSEFRPNG